MNEVRNLFPSAKGGKSGEESDIHPPPLISERSPEELEQLVNKWPLILGGDLVASLGEVLTEEKFAEYLCRTHTFIHGKIGFYDQVIASILRAAGREISAERFAHTQEEIEQVSKLAQTTETEREDTSPLVLIPITSTAEEFNTLVAHALQQGAPIWLVASPSVLQPHLLTVFHNFFVTNAIPDELVHLQYIFRLADSTVRFLNRGIYKMLLVTDYPYLVKKVGASTVVVMRITEMEPPEDIGGKLSGKT